MVTKSVIAKNKHFLIFSAQNKRPGRVGSVHANALPLTTVIVTLERND